MIGCCWKVPLKHLGLLRIGLDKTKVDWLESLSPPHSARYERRYNSKSNIPTKTGCNERDTETPLD